MKFLKVGLIVLAGLFLLLLVGVGLLFLPAVQKGLATRVVSGDGQTLEAEYLRVRPGGVRARNLVFTDEESSYRVGELQLEMSLWTAAFGGEIRVEELRVTGLVVDLSKPSAKEDEEDDTDEVFEGFLKQVQLPMPVYVGKLHVEGEVLLPDRKAGFLVTGGGLAPGETADFEISGDLENPEPEMEAIELNGKLQVRETAAGGFEEVGLALEVETVGGSFREHGRLRLEANLTAVPGGEKYVARVLQLSGETKKEPLLQVDGKFEDQPGQLTADWKMRVDSSQIAEIAAAFELPAFSATGSGDMTYGATSGDLASSGSLLVQTEDLGLLVPEMRGLGAFSMQAEFNLAGGEEEILIETLVVNLRDREDKSLLEIRNSRPVRYSLLEERAVGTEGDEPLLTVSLRELPVEWANLFLESETPEEALVVKGGLVSAQFLVRAESGRIVLETAEPLRAEGISVQMGDEEVLRAVAFSGRVSGLLGEGEMKAELEELLVTGNGRKMVRVTGQYDGASELATARIDGDLAVIGEQPVLASVGGIRGRVGVDVEASLSEVMKISARGTLQEVVLAEVPGLILQGEFGLGTDGKIAELQELLVEILDGDGKSHLQIQNSQPVRYDLEEQKLLGTGTSGEDLLAILIHDLPLELANPFLRTDEEAESLTFMGGVMNGQLRVGVAGEGISFGMAEPIRVEGVGLRQGNEWLLQDAGMTASLSGRLEGEAVEVSVEDFTLLGNGNPMLKMKGKYSSATEEATASVRVWLPILLAQPVLAEMNHASAGNVDLEITAHLGELMRAEVSLATRGIRLKEENAEVADLTLSGKITEKTPDEWEISVPVSIAGEQPSDLQMNGAFSTAGSLTQFQVDLRSKFLNVEDVMELAAVFSGKEKEIEKETPSSEERDTEAFWSEFRGTATLAMEDVLFPGGHPLHGLQGELQVKEEAVTMRVLGQLLESPAEVAGEIRFTGEDALPYVLEGSLEAPELSAAPFFQQQEPNKPPTLEGIFGVSATLYGDGKSLPDLIARTRGKVRMNAKKGVLRLFQTDNPLAGLGMAVGGLLGSISPELGSVLSVAQTLSEVPFDELDLSLERDDELNFLLNNLTLISPQLHLEGVGEVRYRDGLAVLQQPMRIALQMGAQGGLEDLLQSVRVLGDQRDADGYRLLRQEFLITGTPSSPNNSAFYKLLGDTALRFLGSSKKKDEGQKTGEEPAQEVQPQESPRVEDILRGLEGFFGREKEKP